MNNSELTFISYLVDMLKHSPLKYKSYISMARARKNGSKEYHTLLNDLEKTFDTKSVVSDQVAVMLSWSNVKV